MNRNAIRALRVAIPGLVLTVGLITAAIVSASAQDLQAEVRKTKPPFSELELKPASISFAEINLSDAVVTTSRVSR